MESHDRAHPGPASSIDPPHQRPADPALGDAVNVAARLQDPTKSRACEAVLSEAVRVTAGLAPDALPEQEVAIRGRAEPIMVHPVADAGTLSALVGDLAGKRSSHRNSESPFACGANC